MVEESSASTQGLALRLIKEFDSIFNECAYEEASAKQVSANASLKIFKFVISGEDVATEFKSSGLFDSDLSDVSLLQNRNF